MRSSATSLSVLPPAWQLLVIFLSFVPAGRAIVANCTPGWEWSYNSKGQNPCKVAGDLQAACGYGGLELGPIDPSTCYSVPGKGDAKALKCGCNTVIYSLYAACTACQNVVLGTWTGWSENCDSVYVSQYPFTIPAGVAVPRWSFINVTNGDNFNATAAMNTGRDPEVIGKVPVTLFISTSSPLPSSTSNLPHVSATNGPGGPSDPNGGGGSSGRASGHNDLPSIVGGILGGLVGFSILLFLVWLSIRGPPREELPRTAPRPLSYNVPSTQSHYPRSLSVYSPGPEMDERGGQILVIQGHSNNTTPREPAPAYDVRSVISSESDLHTTRLSILYGSGKGYNNPAEF